MSIEAPSIGGAEARNRVTSIGVDIGSTNTKVALVTVTGPSVREVGVRSFPTPATMLDLESAVFTAIRGLLASQADLPVSVGIASMAESGALLDGAHRPLTPILRWTAATARSTALFDSIGPAGRAELYAATGVPALPKVPLATWHRLQLDEPDIWRRFGWWAGVADYLGFALTGVLATDHTLAGRTMAYRLPAAGLSLEPGFDAELLGLVGLTPDRMPQVLAPGEPAGPVANAGGTGLAPGTPVFLAGHDHAVAAWAAGVRAGGHAADSVGTTEALVRVTDDAVDRAAAGREGMSTTRTVAGNRECLLAGGSGGAVLARWVAAHPEKDLAVILRMLESGPPGTAFVLPYPRGRQAPVPDPSAAEVLVGDADAPIDRLRAVLVGLSLHLRWMDETQSRILAEDPTGIRIVGGAAAHNTAWNRVKSALVPRPLALVAASEPVAAGAALLAAVRAGAVSADVTLPSAPIPAQPDPTGNELYRAFVHAATSPSTPESRP